MLVNNLQNSLPKYDEEIEKAILAVFLYDNLQLTIHKNKLKKNDFYLDKNAEIYEAMVKLNDGGYKCDLLSLANYLSKYNKLDQAGGRLYLVQLGQIFSSTSNLETYLSILKEKSKLRQERELSFKLAEAIEEENQDGIKKIKEELIDLESEFLEEKPQPINAYLAAYQKHYESPTAGIPTGLPRLDNLLGEGWKKGELNTIAGPTGSGKSLLCLQWAVMAAKCGFKVLFFNLEMSANQFLPRLFSSVLEIPSHQLKYRTADYNALISPKLPFLEGLPIKLLFCPLTTEILYSTAFLEKMKDGVDLIILDYFSLLQDKINLSKNERDEQLIVRLKNLTMKLDVALITPLAMNKVSLRDNRTPSPEHSLGTVMLNYTADVMVNLSRDRFKKEAKLFLVKNRTGELGHTDLIFDSAKLKFFELDKINPTDDSIIIEGENEKKQSNFS